MHTSRKPVPGREGQRESPGARLPGGATIIASVPGRGWGLGEGIATEVALPKAGGEGENILAPFSTALQSSTDHATQGPADMDACRGSVSRGSEWEKMGDGPEIKQAQVHESPPEPGLSCHGAMVEPGVS